MTLYNCFKDNDLYYYLDSIKLLLIKVNIKNHLESYISILLTLSPESNFIFADIIEYVYINEK